MKILYGVQATGNGHITRARAMAEPLQQAGIEVDYLFSGRSPGKLFDMEPFGAFSHRRGLTFATRNGRLSRTSSLWQAGIRDFFRDVRELDLSGYDLVLTDYEPVSAWAARRQGVRSVGLGHQYAFRFNIPVASPDLAGRLALSWFAPVSLSLGVHWHHFGFPLLPPVIPACPSGRHRCSPQVLVYLPFENPADVLAELQKVEGYLFHMHCEGLPPGTYGNVRIHGFSRDGFQANLQRCQSVLCNAGFELVSEALHMGKRIMVKPLRGQLEQAANAEALRQLQLATTCRNIEASQITGWLCQTQVSQVMFPEVAQAVVKWLVRGAEDPVSELAEQLWDRVISDCPAYRNPAVSHSLAHV